MKQAATFTRLKAASTMRMIMLAVSHPRSRKEGGPGRSVQAISHQALASSGARLWGPAHGMTATLSAPSCADAEMSFLHISVSSKREEPPFGSHWPDLPHVCIPNQELATCVELLWLE